MKKVLIVTGIALIIMACDGSGGPDATLITATASPSASCEVAPEALHNQLNNGFTADGLWFDKEISDIHILNSEAGSGTWTLIAGTMSAPGLDEIGMWATPSLDIDDGDALLLAYDRMSALFTVWEMPGGGTHSFSDDFEVDARHLRDCVGEAALR